MLIKQVNRLEMPFLLIFQIYDWKLVAILKVGGFAKALINTSRSNKLQQTNNDEVSYCGGCNSGTIPSCNRCGVVCHCNCGPSCYCKKSCRCTRTRRCAMHQ